MVHVGAQVHMRAARGTAGSRRARAWREGGAELPLQRAGERREGRRRKKKREKEKRKRKEKGEKEKEKEGGKKRGAPAVASACRGFGEKRRAQNEENREMRR